MTPRDMARVGQMMLADGRWNGRQVIPAAWARESTTAKAVVAPDPKCGTRYGYFWWLFQGCQVTPATPWAAAVGNGGQRILVVPSRGLVVVITAGNYNIPLQGETTNAVVTGVLAAVR